VVAATSSLESGWLLDERPSRKTADIAMRLRRGLVRSRERRRQTSSILACAAALVRGQSRGVLVLVLPAGTAPPHLLVFCAVVTILILPYGLSVLTVADLSLAHLHVATAVAETRATSIIFGRDVRPSALATLLAVHLLPFDARAFTRNLFPASLSVSTAVGPTSAASMGESLHHMPPTWAALLAVHIPLGVALAACVHARNHQNCSQSKRQHLRHLVQKNVS